MPKYPILSARLLGLPIMGQSYKGKPNSKTTEVVRLLPDPLWQRQLLDARRIIWMTGNPQKAQRNQHSKKDIRMMRTGSFPDVYFQAFNEKFYLVDLQCRFLCVLYRAIRVCSHAAIPATENLFRTYEWWHKFLHASTGQSQTFLQQICRV